MKIKLLTLSFLLSLFCAFSVVAQVIDMRAYSRQHGFKAYQPRQTSAPIRSRGQENASRRQREAVVPADDSEGSENVEKKEKEAVADKKQKDQTEEMQKYIADNPQVRPDI